MLNQTSVAVHLPPYDDYQEENDIKEMPWLDITRADCNCSRYPDVSNVGVQSNSMFVASHTQSDSSDLEESDSSPSGNDISDEETNDVPATQEESDTICRVLQP